MVDQPQLDELPQLLMSSLTIKLAVALAAVAMAFGVVGCGSGSDSTTPQAQANPAPAAPPKPSEAGMKTGTMVPHANPNAGGVQMGSKGGG